ncbi:MAG: DUF418 domain-containing protein [Acidobacteriota bacterium]|jgi:uncharacterized protein
MHRNDDSVPETPTVGPTSESERIQILDVLRGFAIFCVLLGNVSYYSVPVYTHFAQGERSTASLDRAVELGLELFVQGRMYPLFALLIGLGIALQLERRERAGSSLAPLHLRRMGLLLCFGVAHVALLWFGDVLILYGILCALLLPFFNRSPRTILIAVWVCLLLPVLMALPVTVAQGADPGAIQKWERFQAGLHTAAERATEVYATGTLGEMALQRLRDFLFFNSLIFMAIPTLFAMLLFGLYIGKRRLVRDGPENARTWDIFLWGGLGTGVTCAVLSVWSRRAAAPDDPAFVMVGAVGSAFAGPALACAVLAAGRKLLERPGWSRRLSPLAAVGRGSLSNYLLQSLAFALIFYGYGLGAVGTVSPFEEILLAAAVFSALLALSSWWFARYRFGPAEWLWRSATYGRWQVLVSRPRREPDKKSSTGTAGRRKSATMGQRYADSKGSS